jgi:hypothetical protein
MKVKGRLLSRCLLMPGGERQARSSFCEQKKQKTFMTALRARQFKTLPSPPARRCKSNEVFGALFTKSAACLPIPAW